MNDRLRDFISNDEAAQSRMAWREIEDQVKKDMSDHQQRLIDDASDPKLSPLENWLFNDPDAIMRRRLNEIDEQVKQSRFLPD